jgi:hypothetical protein
VPRIPQTESSGNTINLLEQALVLVRSNLHERTAGSYEGLVRAVMSSVATQRYMNSADGDNTSTL